MLGSSGEAVKAFQSAMGSSALASLAKTQSVAATWRMGPSAKTREILQSMMGPSALVAAAKMQSAAATSLMGPSAKTREILQSMMGPSALVAAARTAGLTSALEWRLRVVAPKRTQSTDLHVLPPQPVPRSGEPERLDDPIGSTEESERQRATRLAALALACTFLANQREILGTAFEDLALIGDFLLRAWRFVLVLTIVAVLVSIGQQEEP